MKKFIFKILKIRKNEASKIFYFFIFAIFLQSGVAVGESVASSLFLVNIGYEQLPIIYILTPIVMLVFYFPIYSFFVKKYDEDKFFKVSLLFLIVTNILIFIGIKLLKDILSPQIFNLLFYFTFLYTTIWAIALYTLFWNFLDSFFDILDSKRVFSIFSAGTAIGAIIGGTLVSIITEYIPAISLLLIWSIFAFLTYISLLIIKRKFKKISTDLDEEEDEGSFLKQLDIMWQNIKSSRYVLILSIVFFVSIILSTLLEFEYMNILSQDQDEESLASLFGKLFAIVNIFNLFVNFFLFNRLVLAYGVRNVLLIQPIAYLIAFGYLSIYLGFEAGLLGFFVVQGVLVSIDYNNQNFLYNGIKSNIKYQVRTFIENLGEPMAIAVAGFFLFFITGKITPSEIAYIGITLGSLYLIFTIILRYDYPKAMVANLKADWLDFSKNDKELVSNLDSKELIELDKYLKVDNLQKKSALSILYLNDIHKTLKLLLSYLNSVKIIQFQLSKKLLKDILNSKDSEIPKIIIEWLEKNSENLNINLIRELGVYGFIPSQKVIPMLSKNSPKLQATAAVVIWNSQYPNQLSLATEVINNLLNQKNKKTIKEGIYAIGESKHTRYAFFLSKFLKSKNFSVRKQTLLAIYELSDKTLSRLILPILEIFKNGNQTERELSLNILRKIKDSQSIIPLLKISSILRPYEKRKVILLIEELGLQSIPSIVTVLVEDRFSYNARSIAGRTLGKLAFAQFKALEEELIINEIKNAYRFLNFHQILQSELKHYKDDNLMLLSLFYRDIQKVVLEFILEILTIGGQLPDFEMIKTALRSNNAKSRGNAIETIEQSTNKKIFTLLLPLLDARDVDDVMAFYKSKFIVDSFSIEDILDIALKSNNSLEISIALEVISIKKENYLTLFRKKLREYPSPEIEKAIFSLLDKSGEITIVEKLVILIKNKLFKRFNIFELSSMLNSSNMIDITKNNFIYKDETKIIYIYVVLDGIASDGDCIYKKGDIIGFNYIFNNDKIKNIICSDNIKLLALRRESIIDTIYLYPEVGIEFFLTKSKQK